MILDIEGISVTVTKKPIKNMYLRIIPPDGCVHISAPIKQKIQSIHEFVRAKSVWIKAQQERIKTQYESTEDPIQTGKTIPFKGKSYLLIVEEGLASPKISLQGELIHCTFPPNTSPQQKHTLIDQWYRKEMHLLLPDLIQHWEHIIGVRVFEWGIKKMKTRWGSCNTRVGRIWLNLKLIKKPLACLEYVLVHELVHLLEPSHNRRFHALMDQFMPNWREHQLLLEPKRVKLPI